VVKNRFFGKFNKLNQPLERFARKERKTKTLITILRNERWLFLQTPQIVKGKTEFNEMNKLCDGHNIPKLTQKKSA
jgi:hypothetical protein